jgi:hypothetical protein
MRWAGVLAVLLAALVAYWGALNMLPRDGEVRPVRLGPNTTRIPYAEIEAYVARKLA